MAGSLKVCLWLRVGVGISLILDTRAGREWPEIGNRSFLQVSMWHFSGLHLMPQATLCSSRHGVWSPDLSSLFCKNIEALPLVLEPPDH